MTIRKILQTALILVVTTVPALAAQAPQALPTDPRVKQLIYQKDNVYKLDLYLKAITSIQFEKDEVVKAILVGDSASWEIIRLQRGNVISIKPLIADTVTNMTMYTDKRVYTFELHAVGEISADSGNLLKQNYRSTFIYPPEETKKKVTKGKKKTQKKGSKNKKRAKKANNLFMVDENTYASLMDIKYFVAGQSRFVPLNVYDNGRQTFFTLPKFASRPAIFKVDDKGNESLVNSRSRGNVVIVDSVSNFWTLRIGDEAICVSNGPIPYNIFRGRLTNV